MCAYKRKKRYHLKPLPILLLLLLVALIVLAVCFFRSGDEPAPASSAPLPSAPAVSSEPLPSDTATGGEPELSSAAAAPSSAVPLPPAQNTANIPDPPVDNGDGTLSYNGKTYLISELPEGSTSDWNLILLNPEDANRIDAELDFSYAEFDGQGCDERAADSFQAMKDAALSEADVTLYLRSGYRSIVTQNTNYQAAIQRYLDQGYSNEEALVRTNAYYTVPGHSEHHSGLAFDIITPEYHRDIWSLDDRFADTDAYVWLRANSWKYGFVLRYAQNKQDITRISFEPWHYRYVGVEHARFMQENDLCLEEYIALLKAAGK